MIPQRFLTSVLLLNIVPVIAPCPIIRFHHPSCWVNWTLIKLNISSNTFSRALIDKRMGHLIKVFILSCLLSQGLLKSLPAGLETESVSKMPEWEIKITGERKEIVDGKKMSGRESKIFSFADTLDNLGWGNILWFLLLNFLQFLRYLHILELVCEDYSGGKSDVLECYFVVLPIWKPRLMRDAWWPLVLDTRKRAPSPRAQPLHSKQLRTDNDPQDRSFNT